MFGWSIGSRHPGARGMNEQQNVRGAKNDNVLNSQHPGHYDSKPLRYLPLSLSTTTSRYLLFYLELFIFCPSSW